MAPTTATTGVHAVARRASYETSIRRPDYFVVSRLRCFIHDEVVRWVRPGTAVADIGCGEQPMRIAIEARGACYTGIDVNQNSRHNVDVVASITDVPLPDASFDLILCTEVLEHVPDTQAAFKEIARLLRPGGAAIITTPFAYPLHEEPFDFVRLTSYQIAVCGQKFGLSIDTLARSGNELEVIATCIDNMWSRMLQKRPNLFQRMWISGWRVVVNAAVITLNKLFAQALPAKYYLSTFCVLVKPVI